MGADPTGRERTRVAIEAVVLALLAALRLLPYGLHLRSHHVERFSFVGDFAGLAAVMVIVGAVRLAATRTHAVAVAVFVLVALVANGSWRALPFAVLAAGATALAWRRRDSVNLASLGFGGLSSALSVVALRAIVGVHYIYLFFWTTAGTTLLWMGIGGAAGKTLADLLERAPRPVVAQVAALVALAGTFVLALGVSSLWRTFLARETLRPVLDATDRQAYDVLRARSGVWRKTCNGCERPSMPAGWRPKVEVCAPPF